MMFAAKILLDNAQGQNMVSCHKTNIFIVHLYLPCCLYQCTSCVIVFVILILKYYFPFAVCFQLFALMDEGEDDIVCPLHCCLHTVERACQQPSFVLNRNQLSDHPLISISNHQQSNQRELFSKLSVVL